MNYKFPLYFPFEYTVFKYVSEREESYNLISGGTVNFITAPANTGFINYIVNIIYVRVETNGFKN